MGNAFPTRRDGMNCSIQGCPGKYEAREIIHTFHRGIDIYVVEGVPAEVCSVCGDTLLVPETVKHLEVFLHGKGKPGKMAPVYEYA